MPYRSSSIAQVGTTACAPAAPSGYQAGDILVAIATNNSATGVIAFPSGWTQVRSDSAAILDGLTASWGWKVATGSDSFTWTLTGTRDFGVIVAAYTGRNTTSPIDTSSINGPIAFAASPVSVVANTITTAGLDDVIALVSGAPAGGFGAGAWAAPSAMTLRQGSAFTGTGDFAMSSLSDFTQSSPGATGNQTGTWTSSGGNMGYFAYLVGLSAPAAAGSPVSSGSSILRSGSNVVIGLAPLGWIIRRRQKLAVERNANLRRYDRSEGGVLVPESKIITDPAV